MIRYQDEKQLALIGFETHLERELNQDNRWVRLAERIPWAELAEGYYLKLSSNRGRPAKDARMVIGAVIIKHKLGLSDEETVRQIQENPYLQYFTGMKEFQKEIPFVPSLFVEIRRRMGEETFLKFDETIVKAVAKAEEKDKKDNDDEPKNGTLVIDATVAPQAIKYPTDINLLNQAREISEEIIDVIWTGKKPRTYREKARKEYLGFVKRRKPGHKVRRRAIGGQLQYLKRNLKNIEQIFAKTPQQKDLLATKISAKYETIQKVFEQQNEMYRERKKSIENRIVSISQPHVRPIVRGKANVSAEFGAKVSVSLSQGMATVDRIGWNAFNEGGDLPMQVEKYKERHGKYPATVLADTIYGTRENRDWLKEKGIRFGGKPLGRPSKNGQAELKQRKLDYRKRIPIEGKFGQGKNGYGLDYIRAKTAETSEAWIRSIFLVMNLLAMEKAILRLIKQTAQSRKIWLNLIKFYAISPSQRLDWKLARI